jgi:hypothetical protein
LEALREIPVLPIAPEIPELAEFLWLGVACPQKQDLMLCILPALRTMKLIFS